MTRFAKFSDIELESITTALDVDRDNIFDPERLAVHEALLAEAEEEVDQRPALVERYNSE